MLAIYMRCNKTLFLFTRVSANAIAGYFELRCEKPAGGRKPVICLMQKQPHLERRLVPGRSDQEQKAVVFSSCAHGSELSGVGKKLSTNTTPARGLPSRLVTQAQPGHKGAGMPPRSNNRARLIVERGKTRARRPAVMKPSVVSLELKLQGLNARIDSKHYRHRKNEQNHRNEHPNLRLPCSLHQRA